MREVVEYCLQANIEVQPPRGDVIRISTAISQMCSCKADEAVLFFHKAAFTGRGA